MANSPPTAALCQAAIVAGVIVVAALWPPETGAMLLVPLSGRLAAPANVALAGGGALAAPGPLPGSLVVIGRRAAIAVPALRHGILPLSAPRALCGTIAA